MPAEASWNIGMVTSSTRRQRERQRHHQEILAAALNCFARQGFDGTTMAGVAKEAGFAVGTLYKFFTDKQALYRAILLDMVTDIHAELMAALQPPGTEMERINRYIEAKVGVYAKCERIGPLYFARTAATPLLPTVGLDEDIQVMYRRTSRVVESLLRRGIRKKLFVNRDPGVLFILLEGLTHSFVPALLVKPDAFTAEEMAALVKSTFWNGVRL
jgi:TetR/AcrR family transcriptional regulator